MTYGICFLSVLPLKKEPSHRCEMVSQILFGEAYKILTISDDKEWIKVSNYFDKYEGWILTKQVNEIPESYYKEYLKLNHYFTSNPVLSITDINQKIIIISIGSVLPYVDKEKIIINDTIFYSHTIKPFTDGQDHNSLVIENALKYINVPYLWGGRSYFGIDCSGFVQQVYKLIRINLPRDAYQQANKGKETKFVKRRKGDLAYFTNENGKIDHVGILLSENKIIHASGKVQIDKLTQNGIFNEESKKYTHNLLKIMRILKD